MHHVVEYGSCDEAHELRLSWRSLAECGPRPSFLHTLEWLRCWERSFLGSQRLRILASFVNGALVGVTPLVVRRVATKLGWLRVAAFAGDGWLPSVSPTGKNTAVSWYAACQHLRATPRDWDLIDLRGVDALGQDRGRVPNAFRMLNWKSLERPWSQTRELVWSDITPSERAAWKNVRSDKPSQSPTAFVEMHSRDDAQQLGHAALLSPSFQAMATNPTELSFLGEVFQSAACADAARLWAVVQDGVVQAAALGVQTDGHVDLIAAGAASPQAAEVLTSRIATTGYEQGWRTCHLGPRTQVLPTIPGMSAHGLARYTHYAAWSSRSQLLRWAHSRQATSAPPAASAPELRLVTAEQD